MNALVNPKEPEEIGGRFIRRGTAFTFPEGGAEVISLGQDGAFSDVKGLGESLQVQQTSSKLQVRIRYGAIGVVLCDEALFDIVRRLVMPKKRLEGMITQTRNQGGTWKPDTSSTR